MVPKDNRLGLRIKEYRKRKGFSQEDLALALQERYGLKTDRATISKWETGYQEPSVSSLKHIAAVLDISIDRLYEIEVESQKRDSSFDTITRQSLKDNELILLDLWGEIGDEEKEFFLKQLERAAKERGESDHDR